jgi:large subunit ribosomal protein L25
MAKQVKLSAQTRSASGRNSVRALKRTGVVPAVIYGGKEAPANLQVSAREIGNILAGAVGENILVELEIQDGSAVSKRSALIQEVQHHPIRGDVLHVDFHAISMDETIQTSIPIEPVGEANGVRNFGGVLEQSVRSLEIECLPRDLPELITVDVSALNIGDSIHVKNLQLPNGVVALNEPELTVFLVSAPKVEEAPAAEATAAASPEVIREKKEEPAAAAEKK